MDTVEVKILQSEAMAKLDEMENHKLIEVSHNKSNGSEKKPLERGCMKGMVLYMAEDFDHEQKVDQTG